MAGRRISGIFVPIQLDTSNVQRDMEGLNKSLGTVINSIQKKFEGSLNTKTLADNIVKVNRALGELRDSGNALGRINGVNVFKSNLSGLSPALKNISEAFGGTVRQQKELYSQLVKTQAIDQQVKALRTLQRATRLSTEETLKLVRARGMAVSTEAVTRFSKPNTPTAGGRGWSGIFTPTSLAAGAQSALAASGVVAGMYGAVELTKSAYQASLKMENLQLAFESVFGSASKATAQLDFVRQVSDKLGLSFLETAEGAKKMFAAARGTEVENDANQIFQAFSTMSAALKLTGDETNSVFLAISQMMSKGKISAEELRLQLSERMPGAVTLFAKAIGVTTKELDVMLQKGQVGLDSLRKFAVEVQNTYAAGAAGASKGLQAELNRVGTAWFFLKQAFVDAKGSAETLSVLTDTLKGLTAMAPAIAKLAGVFLKFAVATTASYGAVKALTAIKTALLGAEAASVLLGEGLAGLSKKLVAFAKTPLGIALAIAALGVTVWSLISAQSDGMKSIEQYSTSLDDMAKSAGNAAEKMGELNKSVKDGTIELQSEVVLSAQKLFEGAMLPRTQYLLNQHIPVILEEKESSFSRTLEKMKRGGADWNKHISAAQELGKTFSAEFNKAMESGADEETTKAIIDRYDGFVRIIKEKLTQAGQTEVAKTFESAVSSVLNLAKDWSGKTNVFKSMSEDAKDTTQHLLTFNKEFEAIQKITQGTELGKELKYKEEAEASVKSLLAMGKAVQTAHARMAELGSKTAENTEEWKKNEDIVKKNEQAFVLLGQAAIKNKMDLSILNEAIRVVGEDAKMTTKEIEALQKKVAEGFRLGGIKTGENLLKDLDTEIALSKATAGQKKAFSVLSPYIKDDASKFNIVTMLMKDDVKGLQVAFKDTSFVAENMTGILAKAGELAGSVDAKKGASNWESINSAIERATKTLETWKAKLNEKKADEFGVTLKEEITKLDEALASSKATSSQIDQLKQLKAQIEEVGEARRKQIDEEERLQVRKELTRTGSRITREFKKLQGVDNSEVYTAAKQQYDLDVEFFQEALRKKQISQEEFNSNMMMLETNLADAQLRSQTDLYSRLQVAADDYFRKYGDFTGHIGGAITTAMDDSARAIGNFAASGARSFSSLADAMDEMANRLLQTATQLFAQQAVSALWSGVMGLFSPGVGMSAPGMAQGSRSSNGQIVRHANGGAYFGGNLSSYSGSIVSSPTLFSTGTKVPAYASGAGLMGEAGPEGIFPLERDSSGKLGVRAKSGIGAALNQNINVNVINNTSSQVATQETRDNQGNVSIDVMIEEHVGKAMRKPGSAPFKSMQNMWGGTPALAQRG